MPTLYLDRRKSTYLGGLLEHLNARHYQNWSLLTQALRTGMPQSGALATGSYPALYADTTTQDIFLNGMSAGSLMAAKALAKSFHGASIARSSISERRKAACRWRSHALIRI